MFPYKCYYFIASICLRACDSANNPHEIKWSLRTTLEWCCPKLNAYLFWCLKNIGNIMKHFLFTQCQIFIFLLGLNYNPSYGDNKGFIIIIFLVLYHIVFTFWSSRTSNITDEFHPLKIFVESPPHHVHRQVDKLSQCTVICFINCSCVLYAYDISNGSAMLWNDQVPTLKNTSTVDAYNNRVYNYGLKFFLRVGPDRPITSKLKEPFICIFIFISKLKEPTFPLSCRLSVVKNVYL